MPTSIQKPISRRRQQPQVPCHGREAAIEYINEIKGAHSEVAVRIQMEMVVREQMATEQQWIRLCLGITAFLVMAVVVN